MMPVPSQHDLTAPGSCPDEAGAIIGGSHHYHQCSSKSRFDDAAILTLDNADPASGTVTAEELGDLPWPIDGTASASDEVPDAEGEWKGVQVITISPSGYSFAIIPSAAPAATVFRAIPLD
jgi:hypothetical protein